MAVQAAIQITSHLLLNIKIEIKEIMMLNATALSKAILAGVKFLEL